MGVKLAAASGGSIELVPTNTASNFTVTVPAKTGTMAMDGPAFSAYASGTTTVPTATYTKILFATEEFDTNNNFTSSTFTPTVAGYYQFNSCVYFTSATAAVEVLIFKNGSIAKAGMYVGPISGVGVVSGISTIVYCNGSTDYIDIYAYQASGASCTAAAAPAYTWFNGAMVRSA